MQPVLDPRARRGMATQLAHWRALLARGAPRVGWKVGLTDPRMQRRLGIAAPVVGHLTGATALALGAAHALAGGTLVGVESEIAVHLGGDVPAGAARAAVEDAILGLGAALEVIDLRGPLDDLEHAVASNCFHRAVMIGTTNPFHARGVVGDAVLRPVRNGVELTPVAVAAVAGDLPALVALVADTLAAFGEGVRAGDWIITGALTPPVWVEPGDVVGIDVGPLGSLELSCTA
jgi:2-keto-4-pentenoate hydratase